MKIIAFFITLLCTFPVFGKGVKPATVIITAGQSNTDGRVMNAELPEYIQQNGYRYCQWNYGSAGAPVCGTFELFQPRIYHQEQPARWAYDAVVYYWLEQALQEDFYVIKWSLGGTSIDTLAGSTSGKHWSAHPQWLARNHSTSTGGKSLLLSFTEKIDASIDSTLNHLPQEFEIKGFLWHQGESDYRHGANYYDNLRGVVEYVRHFLVEKTGNWKYRKLPFICGTVSRENKNYSEEVEAAMYRLAQDDRNFYVVDMSQGELQRDRLHFTAQSAEYLGIQMYNRLVDLGVAGRKAKKVR